ncbi:MAG: sigma-54 dependent transcriptional regulator [Gemmatimonadota bacterium]
MDILIVDDESNLRRMLRSVLEQEGFQVREAGRAEEAIDMVEQSPPEAILLDLALPGMSGVEALEPLSRLAPLVPVILMSGQASLADAVEATRKGAFHFLEKPLSPEAVLATLRAAREVSRARDLSRALQEELGPGVRLIGESAGIREVRQRIRKVAPTEARILITGESGTGKELAAAAIHALSLRKGRPFLPVNSAALPSELVESELFGHERGAFTGATVRRRGRFELADGGTLFLDEVAELGPSAQAKLLRVLEGGVIERLGGGEPFRVDVRVLAATNRDLRKEVEAGRFREDLLFRLDVIPLPLPPLRERREDIPLLLDHARERIQRRLGRPPPLLDPPAVERLTAYAWPGNVRELFNVVERLAILHPGERVGVGVVDSVLPGMRGAGDSSAGEEPTLHGSLAHRLEVFERGILEGALRSTDGNVSQAAELLETDRANLYRRMRRLNVEPARLRRADPSN